MTKRIGRPPLPKAPLAKCRSCGEAFEPVPLGEGKRSKLCGMQHCYAEEIRRYWSQRGYVAEFRFEEGCPRLRGVVRMGK